MAGVADFFRGGLYDMAGFSPTRNYTSYEGWGGQYTPKTPIGLTKSTIGTQSMGWGSSKTPGLANNLSRRGMNTLGSVARVGMGPIFSTYMGYSEEGMWGAAKWLGAEFAASAFAGAAYAGTVAGSSFDVTMGSTIGMIFGGPGGYVAGAGIGALGGGTAVVGGSMILGAGLATAVGGYYAGKGAYKVLEKGYNYRQKMMTSIDTAGSTAAFMTRNAMTMRSSAVESIRNSHMNARSILGSEASAMSFSSYRKWGGGKIY